MDRGTRKVEVCGITKELDSTETSMHAYTYVTMHNISKQKTYIKKHTNYPENN